MPIKNGDKVKVEYKGTLDDGTVVESSELRGRPLEILVGAGQVLKGFENALLGMEKGEEKEVKIEPKDAYGERNEALVKEVPRKAIPENVELKVGVVLLLKTPEGQQIGAQVKEIKDEMVVLDLNHPLAGQNLTFKIKLVDISRSIIKNTRIFLKKPFRILIPPSIITTLLGYIKVTITNCFV